MPEWMKKFGESASLRILIWLLVGTGSGGAAFAWGSEIWGAVGRSKENAEQITSMLAASTAHNITEEGQLKQIQDDLAYLKMLWGDVVIEDSGDEPTAAVNSRSPAGRFFPGQEVWITNNSDPGEFRIKVKIEERRFRDDPEILMRLSKRAGEDLEASAKEIFVSLEPVTEEK